MQLGKRVVGNQTGAIGFAIQPVVMKNHMTAILGQANVDLHPLEEILRAHLDRPPGVLRGRSVHAAMRHHLHLPGRRDRLKKRKRLNGMSGNGVEHERQQDECDGGIRRHWDHRIKGGGENQIRRVGGYHMTVMRRTGDE